MTGISASSLTVIAPVKADAADELLGVLSSLDDSESPFARVPGTHFARWVHIPELPGADGQPLPAARPLLMMSAEFDSSLAEWVTGLCANARPALDAVMLHCEGFPGAHDPDAVVSFFEAHSVPAGFTVAGYRPVRVDQVREALRLRRALRALAIRVQRERLDGAALRLAWREATRP